MPPPTAVERNFVETWQVIAGAYPDGEIHDANGLTWHAFSGPNDDPRSTSVLRIRLPMARPTPPSTGC